MHIDERQYSSLQTGAVFKIWKNTEVFVSEHFFYLGDG